MSDNKFKDAINGAVTAAGIIGGMTNPADYKTIDQLGDYSQMQNEDRMSHTDTGRDNPYSSSR